MSWVRLDDGFPGHRKVLPLSDAAFRLHVAALCHCNQQGNDGHMDRAALRVLSGYLAHPQKAAAASKELEDSGLWEQTKTGWRIHDFLVYQQSADQKKASNQRAAERMKKMRDRLAGVKTEAESQRECYGVTSGELTENFPRSSHSVRASRPVPSRPVNINTSDPRGGLEYSARDAGEPLQAHSPESGGSPGVVTSATAKAALIRFRARSSDGAGVCRFGYLESVSGEPDVPEIERFRKAMERTRASQTELDLMAARIGRGDAYQGIDRVACSMLCDVPGRRRDRKDQFAELLQEVRTPPRQAKSQGRPSWQDPSIGARRDADAALAENREWLKQNR